MNLIRLIRDKMTEGHVMFVYRGMVTSENTTSLLMLLEKEMESSEFGFQGRKRLFMFVLESLQNVSRHSDPAKHADMSMVIYSKTPDGYTVTTGNVIENAEIGNLKTRLNEINNLAPGDIRSVYRQMLNASEFSSKGGAGLGLIEMAKKTGNKLDYDFIEIDNKYSYFVLSKTVDSSGIGSQGRVPLNKFEGRAVIQIERLFALNNIHLIWSGHFTADVSKEVLSFTETGLWQKSIKSSVKRKVFGILVEALDNVAKHSAPVKAAEEYGMPLVMIQLEGNNNYAITTGNLIDNDRVFELKQKLDVINSTDREGLKNLMKESLRSQQITSESTGNLGLIEMARKSDGRLDYTFEPISDRFSYFTLIVRVSGK
ncbi:MAG: SiaB family protein kinase [Bacteroidales bacterium]